MSTAVITKLYVLIALKHYTHCLIPAYNESKITSTIFSFHFVRCSFQIGPYHVSCSYSQLRYSLSTRLHSLSYYKAVIIFQFLLFTFSFFHCLSPSLLSGFPFFLLLFLPAQLPDISFYPAFIPLFFFHIFISQLT
jgi:hypothetical protein